jgi:hypothetical protein
MIITFIDETDKRMWCSLLNIDIDNVYDEIEIDETDPMTRSLLNWDDDDEDAE